MVDIRGDLIFNGFEPMTAAPCHHDEHELNLSSDYAQEIAHVTALALDPRQIVSSKDEAQPRHGTSDPKTSKGVGAAHRSNLERGLCHRNLGFVSGHRSEPCASAPIEPDQAPIIEFSSVDIFRHSPFGDVLNSLKALFLSGDSQPN